MERCTLAAIASVFSVVFSVVASTRPGLPLQWNIREQTVGLFDKLESGGVGSMAIVGDSISFKQNSYNWFLRDRFWADYGNAGDGYLATGQGFNGGWEQNGPRLGLKIEGSGDSVHLESPNAERRPEGYVTPDGIYARMDGTGAITLSVFGPYCRLHYLKQPGGGVLRLSLNGQTLLEAPTDGGLAHASVDFQTPGGPDTLSSVKVWTADGEPVQTSGLEMRTGKPGLVYHRLGRGGSGPLDFGRSRTPQTAAILSDLSPDLLVVMLDWVGPEEKVTYLEDMRALLDFYEAVMPESRVILMSHHPYKAGIAEQAAWLLQLAQERSVGYINLYGAIPGGLEEMKARGFLIDNVHLSAAGGQFFGDYVYGILKDAGTCDLPVVTHDPDDVTVEEGQSALFGVGQAGGEAFQWRHNGLNIAGATGPAYVIESVDGEDAGVYDVVVSNDCGEAVSEWALLTVLPPTPPAAPDTVRGSEPVQGAVRITWADRSGDETGFQIYRQKRAGNLWAQGQMVAMVPANTEMWSESPGNGVWRYRVRAAKNGLYSAWSAFRGVPPGIPGSLAVQKSNGSALVTWVDASDFEEGFTVERQQNTGTWGGTVTLEPIGADATSITDSPGPGKWRYRIRATNFVGASAWTGWKPVNL
jgi:hypothetical protein